MQYKRHCIFIFVFVFLALISVRCVSPKPTSPTEAVSIGNNEVETAYPSSQQVEKENYPAPEGGEGEIISQELSDVQVPEMIIAPEIGKAAASGVLYSRSSKTVLRNFPFYLTPAQGPEKDQPPPFSVGPSAEMGDIEGETGAEGEFTLENIPPGNYYLIVQAPNYFIIAVTDLENATPRMFTLEEGAAVPLGVVIVE